MNKTVQQRKTRKARKEDKAVETSSHVKMMYWQDGDFWIGYVEEYPDYMSQGLSLDELKENLREIVMDLSSGAIPCARREAELVLA